MSKLFFVCFLQAEDQTSQDCDKDIAKGWLVFKFHNIVRGAVNDMTECVCQLLYNNELIFDGSLFCVFSLHRTRLCS